MMALLATILSALLTFQLGQTSSMLQISTGSDKENADAYFMTTMADRFLAFTAKHEDASHKFSASEEDRLETAISRAHTAREKALLELTAEAAEENRLERENAFGEMKNFVITLKHAMGARGSANNCEELTCGVHSYCAMDKKIGAQCLCKDGYQGNGFICKTPAQFTAHPLLPTRHQSEQQMQIADIHLSTIQGDTIVAVYRDIKDNQRGYAMLGHATPSKMLWGAPVLFSQESQAFSPKLVQLLEGSQGQRLGGIAIAFRDLNRGGDAILLGGRINRTTGKISLGSPRAFTRHQAQGMEMLPFHGSRVALIYAGHGVGPGVAQGNGGGMYGVALLAQMHSGGEPPEVIHRARFSVGPVARISALMLSPTNFAIGYRQGESETGSRQAEAAAILGRMHRNELVFDTQPLLLEPEQTQIWSRSMSLIAENTIAYTYHSGLEGLTKRAVVKLDPATHHLVVVQGPDVVGQGSTYRIGSVALLSETASAEAKAKGTRFLSSVERSRLENSRLLTYFDSDGPEPAQVRLCNVDKLGFVGNCASLQWSGREMISTSAAQVADGRLCSRSLIPKELHIIKSLVCWIHCLVEELTLQNLS